MVTNEMEDIVRTRLRSNYEGIFPPHQIQSYFDEYVGFGLAMGQIAYLRGTGNLDGETRILDIGCGYGSFVVACRREGFESFGIDAAQFEINFAKERIRNELQDDNLGNIFQVMDAQDLRFEDSRFDLVTLWNSIEHIPNTHAVFSEVFRVLKPGGVCVILAPNYLAFRKEAHYLVPWFPLLPKWIGKFYLQILGRRPSFLMNDIHYVTIPRVQKMLKHQGFLLEFARDDEVARALRLDTIHNQLKRSLIKSVIKVAGQEWAKRMLTLYLKNPFSGSIKLIARKPSETI
jgi:MPBQ/MSBQ methyltransferase